MSCCSVHFVQINCLDFERQTPARQRAPPKPNSSLPLVGPGNDQQIEPAQWFLRERQRSWCHPRRRRPRRRRRGRRRRGGRGPGYWGGSGGRCSAGGARTTRSGCGTCPRRRPPCSPAWAAGLTSPAAASGTSSPSPSSARSRRGLLLFALLL